MPKFNEFLIPGKFFKYNTYAIVSSLVVTTFMSFEVLIEVIVFLMMFVVVAIIVEFLVKTMFFFVIDIFESLE